MDENILNNGGQGGQTTQDIDFSTLIPEEFRNDPNIAALPKESFIPTLVKNYVNAEKLIGSKRLALPGENATEEELNAFYAALGRPESHEKYDLKYPDDHPIKMSPEMEKFARQMFFKAGLSSKQARELFDSYNQYMKEEYTRVTAAREADLQKRMDELVAEFGGPEMFTRRVEAAKRLVDQTSPEFKKWLDDTGLANEPMLIREFAKFGVKLFEDSAVGGSAGTFGMTPAEAKAKIADLYQDKDFQKAYNDNANPGHVGAIEKMNTLFKLAYPEISDRE